MSRRYFLILVSIIAVLTLLTVLQDSLYSNFHTTSFYFSESFLFTSFWWIFVPFLYLQYLSANKIQIKAWLIAMLMAVPVILHFIAFPVLVWIISGLFFENTFRLRLTFNYMLSERLYIVLLMYTAPVAVYLYAQNRKKKEIHSRETQNPQPTTLVVTEGQKKRSIPLSDILYVSANSPYINIHTAGKVYLHSESLKSILHILGADFVRIHKSSIVNMQHVDSFTSRFNGDYDLMLNEGTTLRISRNYVSGFKAWFGQGHRLAVK